MRPGQMDQAFAAANAAQSVVTDLGGPLGMVARMAGLGSDELDAGIPGWAWLGIGLIVGGGVAYTFRNRLERVIGDSHG